MSGAYWRGDAKTNNCNASMAQHGRTKKQLKAYLQRLEEAEKRDHRKIGKALNLFHMQRASPRHGVLAPQWLDNLAST